MDTEKLKPWNWFKHEEGVVNQMPVPRSVRESNRTKGASNVFPTNTFAIAPLIELHEEMDRLFDDTWRSFGVTPRSTLNRQTGFGKIQERPNMTAYHVNLDIAGNEKEYMITADLPGLSDSDINLEVVGNTLRIEGHKEDVSESTDSQYYCVERSAGAFIRTLALPDDADSSDIVAKMENGVLNIHLPRRPLPEDNVKRISISK